MTKISKRRDQFSETAIDEEIVVMSLDSGTFFSLTGTGRTIWELLDRHSSRSELLAELARAYDMGEDDIAPDLDRFVAALSEAGLVASN
ncbi:MAG: PqqD family protein [Novosphingobium sp.]